jgi:hypothetical protein
MHLHIVVRVLSIALAAEFDECIAARRRGCDIERSFEDDGQDSKER